jgi:acetylxylan esterase
VDIRISHKYLFSFFKMVSKVATALLLAGGAIAAPAPEKRANCPPIHVFGARETTAPAGYGSSSTVVNLVLSAHSGATSEAINYPACGGQSSCGGVSYANSVVQGISAVASAVNSFNQQCPDTQLVLVGYSQVRVS